MLVYAIDSLQWDATEIRVNRAAERGKWADCPRAFSSRGLITRNISISRESHRVISRTPNCSTYSFLKSSHLSLFPRGLLKSLICPGVEEPVARFDHSFLQ